MKLGWTLESVTATVAGTSIGGAAGMVVDRIETDTRHLTPGALFVAIVGQRFDGHDYAAAARETGAGAVIVRPGLEVEPRIEVADTLEALRALAARRRSELTIPVVAITGSTGKTSTKDLLAACLEGSWVSPKSFNNEVGVPLTVLATPDDARYLVLEVGSRGVGHIAHLAPVVAPDVAVITNLGVVHMETFGTPEALAAAKWELVELLEGGGTAVVPADESRLLPPIRAHSGATLSFGRNGDVAIGDVEVDDAGRPAFTLSYDGDTVRVRLPLVGRHHAENAAAAVAASVAVGVDFASAAANLEVASASAWRMERHEGTYVVVNDAYNANPDSMASALQTVAAMPGRHVAVVGRMAELGHLEESEHVRMGALARELGYHSVIVVGEDPGFAKGAGDIARTVATCADAHAAVAALVEPGDVVLVKASRSVGLEQLALQLAAEAAR